MAGCGDHGTDADSIDGTGGPRPLFHTSHARHLEFVPAFGEWLGPCEPALRGSGSLRFSLFIDDGEILRTETEFEDARCQDTNLVQTTAYDLNQVNRRPLGPGSDTFDASTHVTFVQLRIAPRYGAIANLRRLCGIMDWRDGEQRRVDGAPCAPYVTPASGTPIGQSFVVDGAGLSADGRRYQRVR